MKNLSGLIRPLLALSKEEVTYQRRGFRGATESMRQRLEQVGMTFLQGYHTALEHGGPELLGPELNKIELELRGFAFEGAAMGLAVLDSLTPWRADRISRFLRGAGEPHAYMVHVALGWVWARMPIGIERSRKRLDPLLSWLAYDGWGFHEGFFHWPKYVEGQPAPKRLRGYERRAFDQGLGRSWWFVNGGNPELIQRTINSFPASRQGDMWSGVGLAATYAGIASEDLLHKLLQCTGSHWPALAQGSAFAAKARQRAGNLTVHTELASRVFCAMPAEEAARLSDFTLENLPADGSEPAFEIWRKRIQEHFRKSQTRENVEPLQKAC